MFFSFVQIRRHEIHKSKNRALVHWELQEKALKRKWKKQKPEISNLERRRLSIMKEVMLNCIVFRVREENDK